MGLVGEIFSITNKALLFFTRSINPLTARLRHNLNLGPLLTLTTDTSPTYTYLTVELIHHTYVPYRSPYSSLPKL